MFPNSENGEQGFMRYAPVGGQPPRTNLLDCAQLRTQTDLPRPQSVMNQHLLVSQGRRVSSIWNGQPRGNVAVVKRPYANDLPGRPRVHIPTGFTTALCNYPSTLQPTCSDMAPQKRKSPVTNQPVQLQKPANYSNVKSEPVSKVAKLENNSIKNRCVTVNLKSLNFTRSKFEKTSCSNSSATSSSNSDHLCSRTLLTRVLSAGPSNLKGIDSADSCRKRPVSQTEKDEDVNFDSTGLRNHLFPVWESLFKCELSKPFKEPVDPVKLGCPDYFDIVKKPMDLGTIVNKLNKRKYSNPWQFCDDIWLMFNNAWLYNRKTSKVHKLTTKLSEIFMEEMDPVMQTMGYCCSRELTFTPYAIFCYGSGVCTIARDQTYMMYEQPPSKFGLDGSEYIYCMKCFDELGSSITVPKEKFVLKKNDVIHDEPFEKCKSCHRKWHSICALFNKNVFPSGFVCDSCREGSLIPRPLNNSTARMLPHNKLSLFLENRVNKFLNSKSWRYSEPSEVIIRTLCVQDKEHEVKPLMREKFASEGFPDRFPYRTKSVFAFEVIDGMEVCFFAMHVQEYGSNVPSPNKRCVYISYLDSVQYFQPRELRTDVYHEILLGYFDYVRTLGYATAHIWACPPAEGDDYIFHCHPPEQKIPKPKRLQAWYKTLLDKGIRECSISEYKDIHQHALDDGLFSPTQLPYFEGDFWPNVIEDCIRETKEDEIKRKKLEEVDNGLERFTCDSKHSSKNRKKRKNGIINNKKQSSCTGNILVDKLFSMLEKHKDVFFTIRLMAPKSEHSLISREIVDPDPVMSCELMDGREVFLTKARNEHWEFSSLRRAKYSTLVLCHALHDNKERITCNKCSEAAFVHCTFCEDFDLCHACIKREPHLHQMDIIRSNNDSTVRRIEDCVAYLHHACSCHNTACTEKNCNKMKKVVFHAKSCKKYNSVCPFCKQLISICCYHAKQCKRDICPIPFCVNLRLKLSEQQRSVAHRSDMMMRRRMGAIDEGDVLKQDESPGT